MHRIAFGEPGDLRDLIHNLREDRHFAMDFWAMVGDLSARERGMLNDEEMLNAIVEGTTGLKVEALPQEEKAVHQLKQLLAGVDVEAEQVLSDAVVEPEDTTPGEPQSEPMRPSSSERETLPPQSEKDIPISRARMTIADALLRLEETSRELREQLAAIERMKAQDAAASQTAVEIQDVREAVEKIAQTESVRVEPATESGESAAVEAARPIEVVTVPAQEIPIQQASAQKPQAREASARETDVPVAAVAAMPEQMPVVAEASPPRGMHEPQVFAPRPMHSLTRRGLASRDEDDDPSIGVPLADYAETHRRNRVVIAVGIVLLLALAGATWFAVTRGYAQQWMSASMPAVENKLQLFREELHDLTGKGQNPKPEAAQSASTPAPEPTAPASAGTATAANPAPPAKAAPADSKPETPPPTQETQPPSSTSTPPPAVPAESSPSPVREEMPSPMEMSAIKVPSSIMEGYLVSSRVPAYPEAAKAMGLEGTVVLIAVISRSGNVEQVRVLEGDSRLRAAAEDAVMKWRYKPYLLNGRPVDVATQVRVTFSRSRR